MVPNGLKEELRGTWGPAPSDPEIRFQWEESLDLLARVPELLAKKVRDEGTPFQSLIVHFHSLDELSRFQRQCIERFLTERNLETIHDVIVELTKQPPWSSSFADLSRVQKSRLRKRLTEDLKNNLLFVLVSLEHREVIRRLFDLD